MNVNLSKGIDQRVDNTGTVSVTNISPQATSFLASTTKPERYLYYVLAGYGDRMDLISDGHVQELSWRHEGGDTTVDFSISEGSKFLSNHVYEIIGVPTVKEGSSVYEFISKIERDYLEVIKNRNEIRTARDEGGPEERIQRLFDYDGNRELIENELKEKRISSNLVVDDIKEDLATILDEAGYRYFTDKRRIIIQRKKFDRSFVQSKERFATRLNFKTGLLNISVENYMDYKVKGGLVIAQIKFKALFIPALIPRSFVNIDEPRYPDLNGFYRIYKTDYSLDNKTGGFFMNCVARNLDFRNPLDDADTIQEDQKAKRQLEILF